MSIPQSLYEVQKRGYALAVVLGEHRCLIGGIAWSKGKTAVVALGWDDPGNSGGHPFHVLPGEVDPRGPGPWTGPGVRVEIVPEEDDVILGYIYWRSRMGDGWRASLDRGNAACADLLSHQFSFNCN